jgi:long-chain acyl-CoA synthetase
MTAALERIDTLFAHNARTLPRAPHLLEVNAAPYQTYAQTYERAARLAQAMVSAGLQPGQRVLLFTGNSRELVELFIACALAGAICVPVNTLSSARELLNTALDCTPAQLFMHAQFADRIDPQLTQQVPGLKVAIQGSIGGWRSYDELVSAHEPLAGPLRHEPEDPAVMIYSSGTTGRPKGILLRHSAIVLNAQMTQSVARYQLADRNITLLPMFSSFGYCWDFIMPALAGSSVVILPRFDPEQAWQLVQKHRASILVGVPTMFARLFDPQTLKGKDISSVRLMDVGGGPVSDRLKQDLKQVHGIEIIESYGLSEISPVAAAQIPFDQQRPGSTGPTLPGVEVKVIDAQGQVLPPNTPGELCFRSRTFMAGYWNQPEKTAEAIREGWLHSGDIGVVDEDGHVYIRDRIKDMIVSNGFNVYPKEVENALCEHPQVQTAAVVGVPDEIRGELIHAFVVRKEGAQIQEQELLAHTATLVGKHKIPRGISFVTELPLTASGKIQRFALREQLQRAQG